MIIEEDAYLAHYGTPRHSGRYPWGSGGKHSASVKRSMTFLDHVQSLREKGLSDPEIAEGMGIKLTQLRSRRTVANAEIKQAQIGQAERLREKGMSFNEIAKSMNLAGESSVRALLAPGVKEKAQQVASIAAMLKKNVDEKGLIDVGTGVETHVNTAAQIGVSAQKLSAAVDSLVQQGYTLHQLPQPQVTNAKNTKRLVLAPPGTTQKEAWSRRAEIQQIVDFSKDHGREFGRPLPPLSIDSRRVQVLWKEDGGDKADGVLYVREGVHDVHLGNNRYAQVRVMVDGTHYLKGMAIYKEGLPPGVDIVFNSTKSRMGINKETGKPFTKLDALKPKETKNPDYPFGAVVSQLGKDLGTPKGKLTSVMNIVNEEKHWLGWTKTLSAQVLTKQSPTLAKEQLTKSYDRRRKELDEINALTNPVIKRKLMEKAADSFDSAAVHLKAASLTQRDAWHVILPIDSLHPGQVFAPRYRNGERVALIRYPHGGTFEIPDLIVNNKNREALRLIGKDAGSAIGIHHEVAKRLSGADFDGDTVLVIPNSRGKIKSTRALEKLKDFDPVQAYPKYPGMRAMTKAQTGREMGEISNLITDMTLRGAPRDHIARAVKHSMVVIDAAKKELNYKQSYLDNNIRKLKEDYQFEPSGRTTTGASTLISRKKQDVYRPETRVARVGEGGPIDAQGRVNRVPTGATRIGRDGVRIPKQEKVRRLATVDDLHDLSSGTPHEKLYADYGNRLKALANEARLTASKVPPMVYSPQSAKTYAKEVASLNSKLVLVKMNRPRERQAQQIADAQIRAIRQENPHLEKDKIKAITFREQENARIRMNAKAEKVQITPSEWAAIQAGAIHHSKLSEILDKADLGEVRKLATPRRQRLLSDSDQARARTMLSRPGVTRSMVAQQLGVSLSTLDRTLAEG